jgi:hypothetical protein
MAKNGQSSPLTKRQGAVLQMMVDDDGCDLVYERGVAYVGDTRIAPRTVFALVRMCAISLDSYSQVGQFERYHINETGISLLE